MTDQDRRAFIAGWNARTCVELNVSETDDCFEAYELWLKDREKITLIMAELRKRFSPTETKDDA